MTSACSFQLADVTTPLNCAGTSKVEYLSSKIQMCSGFFDCIRCKMDGRAKRPNSRCLESNTSSRQVDRARRGGHLGAVNGAADKCGAHCG